MAVLIPLQEATPGVAGGKAGALGSLVRGGFSVPPGFAIPLSAYRSCSEHLDLPGVAASRGADEARRLVEAQPLSNGLLDQIADALRVLGDRAVAVRSSAGAEDTDGASAAGQYESELGVQGVDAVADAVRRCWGSLWSPRAVAYRRARGMPNDAMGVVIQHQVDAEVAGVMFTAPSVASATTIEAFWGLGDGVVQGRVTPDAYVVSSDGSVRRSVGDKSIRVSLDDPAVHRLWKLGQRVTALFREPQDVEWAMERGQIWLVQSRPITASLPDGRRPPHVPDTTQLGGTPASAGTATGRVRVVRRPEDFEKVTSGDILVCETTDPAWTPLFDLAAGVLTQTGGLLCHAAIVARERGIPAVVGIAGLLDDLADGAVVTVDGRTGTVALTPPSP